MTKTQLIAHIAQTCGVSKRVAAEMVNSFVNAVVAGVKKGDDVRIQGFGTFKKSARKARVGVNPRKPSEKIKIPAMNVPTFKAGSDFKKAVR
jgi:DNA-binding protein HU-beta